MNTFKLNTKSWHYHLAAMGSSRSLIKEVTVVDENGYPKVGKDGWIERRDVCTVDFCSYCRRVMFGFVAATFFIFLALFISFLFVVAPLMAFVGMVFHLDYLVIDQFFADFLMIEFLVGLLFSCAFVIHALGSNIKQAVREGLNERAAKDIPDGFFVTRYKAWKGKFCPSIEVVE